LRDELDNSGQVAIAKVAVRQREATGRPSCLPRLLVMTTMLWPDEVRTPDFPFLDDDPPQVRPQVLTVADSLIDSLSEPVFESGKYHDSYREALESMIEAKVAGRKSPDPRLPAGSLRLST
jgi:DNA end-binding protein Ku